MPLAGRSRLLYPGLAALAAFLLLIVAGRAPAEEGSLPPPFPPAAGGTYAPLVFTYFYYWYDLPRGAHSDELTHRPAEPDASYRNVEWFRKQLRDMDDAGIDVALAVYWGPGEPSSDVGLANMAWAARELRQAGGKPPRIGLFLDTGFLGTWTEDERDLTKRENQRRLYQLVRTFYSILPRDLWALVDGRPVLWLWANYFGIAFDQSLFEYLTRSFAFDFGPRPFIVGERSWRLAMRRDLLGNVRVTNQPVQLDDFYAWGAALSGFRPSGGMAQVGPGYDERSLTGPNRDGRYTDREDGRFYERNLEAALASGSRFLAIETWNEFHEATDVADSVEHGRQYIEITRRYADRFKSQFAASSGALSNE